MTFDEARAAFPHLGFGVYAYDPKGGVTLECHGSEIFTFKGATLQAAIDLAFPPEEPATPAPVADPDVPDDDVSFDDEPEDVFE